MKKWSFLVLACLLFSACGPKDSSVEDVKRIITVLASDEMKGRQAFSPEAMDAARYIASEFESAGVSPLESNSDFVQEFPMYAVSTAQISVSLNGQAVAAENVAARLSSESINWANKDSLTMVFVGPKDDLIAAWRTSRSSPSALIIVDPSQKEAFEGVAASLGRPMTVMNRDGGNDLVVILSPLKRISALSITAETTATESVIANVAGMIKGKRTDEIVIFSAHYDHIGIRSGAEADSIANGANDNASGTTAVIQLARHFASRPQPERTIYFVAFTAEEMGGFGSRYFSGQVDPDQIVAMFNIEMIGKPAVEGPNTAWITGFDRTDFGPILQKAVEGTVFSFYPDPYPDQNLFFRSDNATLARLGVPAHSISTTPIDVDQDYHQVSDEVSTLDLVHLNNTIQAIAAGAATIISGQETPSRVDPSTLN